jgi:hypothetical protein
VLKVLNLAPFACVPLSPTTFDLRIPSTFSLTDMQIIGEIIDAGVTATLG